MMIIGPQVAFVDDVKNQITPLDKVLQDLNTGTVYFNAKPELNAWPEKPLETVKLLFLDLYYKKDFDVEMSAQWVESIIAPNTRYHLIIWSQDTQHTAELLEYLANIDLSPVYVEAWQKSEFNPQTFDFKDKIVGLIKKISDEQNIDEEIIYGEIVEVEDDGVLINCRLNADKPTFQVRRFDTILLANVPQIKTGTFVRLHIYTKRGARLIDIFEERKDQTELFNVPDFFKGLEGNSFFIEG